VMWNWLKLVWCVWRTQLRGISLRSKLMVLISTSGLMSGLLGSWRIFCWSGSLLSSEFPINTSRLY
jgi:hypothetical protein